MLKVSEKIAVIVEHLDDFLVVMCGVTVIFYRMNYIVIQELHPIITCMSCVPIVCFLKIASASRLTYITFVSLIEMVYLFSGC